MTPLIISFCFLECVNLEMNEGNTYNQLKSPASNGDNVEEGLDNHGGIRS